MADEGVNGLGGSTTSLPKDGSDVQGMSEKKSPSRWKRWLWIAGPAVVAAVLAIWGARPAGAVFSSATGALVGWRMDHSTTAELGSDERLSGLNEAFRAGVEQLELPAQVSVVAQWDRFYKAAAQLMEEDLAQLPKSETGPSAELRAQIAQDAAELALAERINWMSGRTLFLSTAIPVTLLHAAARVDALTPFSFVTGTVATTIAAPLLIRLAGKVRVWNSTLDEGEKHATRRNRFRDELARIGIRGVAQPDPLMHGRYARAEAMRVVYPAVASATTNPDHKAAHEHLALVIAELALAFPEVPINELWSRQVYLHLGPRFGNQASYDEIQALLVDLSKEFDLSLDPLETHLRQMLRPQVWAKAS